MLPDEIIKNKEWDELTILERQQIRDVVADEQEFYLLKRMMQVSVEEASDVPKASEALRDQIRANVMGSKPKRIAGYWYAVAASLLVLMLAAVFILKKRTPPDTVSNTQSPRAFDTMQLKRMPVSEDTAVLANQQEIIPGKPGYNKDSVSNKQKGIAREETLYAVAQVRVADEKELLSLITEIY